MNGQSSLLQTCYGKASCCSPLHNMLSISLRNFLDGSFKTNGQYRVRYPLSLRLANLGGRSLFKQMQFSERLKLCHEICYISTPCILQASVVKNLNPMRKIFVAMWPQVHVRRVIFFGNVTQAII